MENERFYHLHRKGNLDSIWKPNNQIIVDSNFISLYYEKLLKVEKVLIDRYGNNYDLDYIIAMMEEMLAKDLIEEEIKEEFIDLLNKYYILRRERALEEGRKLYNPVAPCRYHSIYLADNIDLCYWENVFAKCEYQRFLVEVEGNTFISSDKFFPSEYLLFDNQVEASEYYWKPKNKSLIRNEILFQGKLIILE